MHKIFAVAAGALLFPFPVLAQEISAEDILERFNAQRDAFTEVRESGGMKTRNLELVTLDDLDEVDAQETVTALSEPDSGDDLQPLVTPSDGGAQVTSGPEPLSTPGSETPVQVASDNPPPATFGQLAPELQVNLFVNFAFDSAAIQTDQKPSLDRMCTIMKDSDIEIFQIVGHTDTAGSDDYNERLSRLRAEEVARYLIGSCGIAETRLTTLGLGERFPINASNPRADENRRVEFQALS